MFVLFTEDTLQIVQTGDTPKAVGAGLVVGELIRDAAPPYNAATHKLVETPSREGDNLRLGWSVVALSPSELAAKAAATAAAAARADAVTELNKTEEVVTAAKTLDEFKPVIVKQLNSIAKLLSVK